ncbi:MAG TPA: VTT domain-containing protein [Candidatus Acidoferrales bacterium]|nr:VTT domain-containing protein [Candidatus Acidoferrales bacterium]
MTEIVHFLLHHGYSVLFAWVFAEAAGLPLPAAPILLAAGALAGMGSMYLPVAVALPMLAAIACDMAWYALGQRYGSRILHLLCRISLEPDSCVRRTQMSFERRGSWALVVAKFIPGLNAMTSPLAGMSRMPLARFVLYDALGAFLWASGYIATGFVFSANLERVVVSLRFLGGGLLLVLFTALAAYILWKWQNRQRFLGKLRVARITPEELKKRMDAGEDVVVVDLRHPIEFDAEPQTIWGAVRMDPADLEEAIEVIPRDREIILFCSCPNEATAAQMALRLQSQGITRIRPLAEGLEGWRKRGFPMQGDAEAVQPA